MSTSYQSPVHASTDGGIMTLTMNRPECKNAINIDMYEQLANRFAEAADDKSIRVVVITGAGGCFTSGNDLMDFASNPPTDEKSAVAVFLRTLYTFEKPVIAAVDGNAVGIGTTMLLHCDLVYASAGAKFKLPFVNLGLCPEFACSQILPLLAGHVRASELLLLGESFGVDTARDIGIINTVAEGDSSLNLALENARKVAAQPPMALRKTKALIRDYRFKDGFKVMEEEMKAFRDGLQSPEFAEAVGAFFEKRAPDFSKFD
ncbi:enoyl-CoA hydratase [Marinibactrum halimedae]|uniref:Enoyl-CoA hydratase n=1 Tax=Marinibactrum halimedae TaxID=1444977 RepID=A0AA37T467_9GAMM|nr:enoyl-CoA hydratase [Marinibactrum halimedae]MCD9460333.1 enoyl-CoA hydratase [Marinibactrum halimedae]GLS26768.1 enoyl-CoA hydratase [Marinibactrum halimedae]